MTIATDTLTECWTVNEVLRCFPLSFDVLNSLGIDTCCGGHDSLGVAGENAGVSPEVLINAILPCTVGYEPAPTFGEPNRSAL